MEITRRAGGGASSCLGACRAMRDHVGHCRLLHTMGSRKWVLSQDSYGSFHVYFQICDIVGNNL